MTIPAYKGIVVSVHTLRSASDEEAKDGKPRSTQYAVVRATWSESVRPPYGDVDVSIKLPGGVGGPQNLPRQGDWVTIHDLTVATPRLKALGYVSRVENVGVYADPGASIISHVVRLYCIPWFEVLTRTSLWFQPLKNTAVGTVFTANDIAEYLTWMTSMVRNGEQLGGMLEEFLARFVQDVFQIPASVSEGFDIKLEEERFNAEVEGDIARDSWELGYEYIEGETEAIETGKPFTPPPSPDLYPINTKVEFRGLALPDIMRVIYDDETRRKFAPSMVDEPFDPVVGVAISRIGSDLPYGANLMDLIRGTFAADSQLIEMFPQIDHDPKTGEPLFNLIYRMAPFRVQRFDEFTSWTGKISGTSTLDQILEKTTWNGSPRWKIEAAAFIPANEVYTDSATQQDTNQVTCVAVGPDNFQNSPVLFWSDIGLPIADAFLIQKQGLRFFSPSWPFWPIFDVEAATPEVYHILEWIQALSAYTAHGWLDAGRFYSGSVSTRLRGLGDAKRPPRAGRIIRIQHANGVIRTGYAHTVTHSVSAQSDGSVHGRTVIEYERALTNEKDRLKTIVMPRIQQTTPAPSTASPVGPTKSAAVIIDLDIDSPTLNYVLSLKPDLIYVKLPNPSDIAEGDTVNGFIIKYEVKLISQRVKLASLRNTIVANNIEIGVHITIPGLSSFSRSGEKLPSPSYDFESYPDYARALGKFYRAHLIDEPTLKIDHWLIDADPFWGPVTVGTTHRYAHEECRAMSHFLDGLLPIDQGTGTRHTLRSLKYSGFVDNSAKYYRKLAKRAPNFSNLGRGALLDYLPWRPERYTVPPDPIKAKFLGIKGKVHTRPVEHVFYEQQVFSFYHGWTGFAPSLRDGDVFNQYKSWSYIIKLLYIHPAAPDMKLVVSDNPPPELTQMMTDYSPIIGMRTSTDSQLAISLTVKFSAGGAAAMHWESALAPGSNTPLTTGGTPGIGLKEIIMSRPELSELIVDISESTLTELETGVGTLGGTVNTVPSLDEVLRTVRPTGGTP